MGIGVFEPKWLPLYISSQERVRSYDILATASLCMFVSIEDDALVVLVLTGGSHILPLSTMGMVLEPMNIATTSVGVVCRGRLVRLLAPTLGSHKRGPRGSHSHEGSTGVLVVGPF